MYRVEVFRDRRLVFTAKEGIGVGEDGYSEVNSKVARYLLDKAGYAGRHSDEHVVIEFDTDSSGEMPVPVHAAMTGDQWLARQ